MKLVLKTLFTAAMMMLLTAVAASALPLLPDAVGIQAVGVTATSNFGDIYVPERMIDQSDLSDSYVSGVTSTSVIDAFTNSNSGNGWHGSLLDTTGSITFDLGGVFTLDRVYLYWMNGGTANNIADLAVQVSSDAGFGTFVTAATFGTPSADRDRIDFSSLATGQYVRLDWTSLQGEYPDQYPGLNEFIAGGIAYIAPVPEVVPEAGSIELMGIALAALALAKRRLNKVLA